MIGRLALNSPFELARVDGLFFGSPNESFDMDDEKLVRQQILLQYADYL